MDEQTAKRDLIRVCHLMYERSYVVSSDGNVSVRLDDGRILATPTMTCKGRMTEDLIAITDLEGKALNNRRASSELAMHLLIYRERPDVNAVCHAHPPNALEIQYLIEAGLTPMQVIQAFSKNSAEALAIAPYHLEIEG